MCPAPLSFAAAHLGHRKCHAAASPSRATASISTLDDRSVRQDIRAQPPVLKDISFHIPAGNSALFAPSGAGKTTILNLLLRLYVPDAGTIKVDGINLDAVSRCDWLGQLAVAGQDVELVEWDRRR
jgi:ABC-type multidrug transport system fused ATPase/permease subunit